MKRYYLTPIVGTGRETDPYRPKIASLDKINWSALIPTDPAGHPTQTHALVLIAAPDDSPYWSVIDADEQTTRIQTADARTAGRAIDDKFEPVNLDVK